MIIELLKSISKPKQIGEEYGLNPGIISRWKREFTLKSGVFSKNKYSLVIEMPKNHLKKKDSIYFLFRQRCAMYF